MSPGARRILIPLIVAGLALGVVLLMVLARSGAESPADENTPPAVEPAETPSDTTSPPTTPGDEPAGDGDGVADPDAGEPASPAPASTFYVARAPDRGTRGHATPPATLGSLDPQVAQARIEFSRAGAGIAKVTFSDIWASARARHLAAEHREALAAGDTPETPLPPDELRYVLQETQTLRNRRWPQGLDIPVLAANQLELNGQRVNLFDYNRAGADDAEVYIWAETAPGVFETEIFDDADALVLRVTRSFTLGDDYGIELQQRLENLTPHTHRIKWMQYGPSSLPLERSRYMDRRRFRFGYLPDPEQYPNRDIVLAEDNDLLLERNDVVKRWQKAQEALAAGEPAEEFFTLWPNRTSRDRNYELSWFGSTNRYFAIAVHPPLVGGQVADRSLADHVEQILEEVSDPDPTDTRQEQKVVFTYLVSPERTIAPEATFALDVGVYAGPLDRHVLGAADGPYRTLAMDKLILYQMSSMCAICTFQWLAHGLLGFLTLLDKYVLFDWGLAIVGLVLVVRTLLHPLTKKTQVNMQRFGKQMSAMKPELDKLQKKFPNDPKRMQQEQLRLMREHGVNPLQMLGCLPMFLQTPIWIALYAMLYFAFDIRQEPAFFGIFQVISGGAWPFLADLSAADHFFGEFASPRKFLLWNITGINVLPILMGAIFFVQQKYMSPPPSPTMSEDQLRQQKMMKVLMVIMFPLMLYSAPSGLTLYILTSSTIGIFESRYIRAHVEEMDLKPKPKKTRTPAGGRKKPKDAQGRAYAEALARMEQKRKLKKSGPPKKYKKRR
ncbi:MAG: membrane protein insertase YidC [Phycisphaerales bacterium]|nr:membrane protein insertase YidC [Phycisphaerae bacterium]NNF44879.1 membrane protein insertase YidC [Phycisphaerales bacterium]NNM26774.1 membrane protein insertase YidC [Phycisphaerales bacterium]